MQDELDNGIKDYQDKEHVVDQVQPQVVSLGKGQKIAVFILAVFTLILILVIIGNLGSRISQPIGQSVGSDDSATSAAAAKSGSGEDVDLQSKDTDGDGLSDWDELNVYKTSPYLEDSDSDGYSDSAEVESNNNPNCPIGKDCGFFLDSTGSVDEDFELNVIESTGVTNTGVTNTGVTNTAVTNTGGALDVSSVTESDLQSILSGESTASTLRKALLSSGVDPNMLNQISDEDLLAGYKESLQQ